MELGRDIYALAEGLERNLSIVRVGHTESPQDTARRIAKAVAVAIASNNEAIERQLRQAGLLT